MALGMFSENAKGFASDAGQTETFLVDGAAPLGLVRPRDDRSLVSFRRPPLLALKRQFRGRRSEYAHRQDFGNATDPA
jgi:hypothetical protein